MDLLTAWLDTRGVSVHARGCDDPSTMGCGNLTCASSLEFQVNAEAEVEVKVALQAEVEITSCALTLRLRVDTLIHAP